MFQGRTAENDKYSLTSKHVAGKLYVTARSLAPDVLHLQAAAGIHTDGRQHVSETQDSAEHCLGFFLVTFVTDTQLLFASTIRKNSLEI